MCRRRLVSPVSVLLALVLVITILEVDPAAAGPGTSAAATTTSTDQTTVSPSPDATQRPDLVSAELLARHSGHQVEVTGARSERVSTWANPDGSLTSKVSSEPQRWQDSKGGWHDLDLTLAAGADGGFASRSVAPGSGVGLPGSADGSFSLPSVAGALQLAHPSAEKQAGVTTGTQARYAGALGERDLLAQVLVDGLEEQVVLQDASASGSWTDVFTVPAGVTARAGGAGVEFVDQGGRVVAGFGGGLAHDSNQAAPGGEGAETDVVTRLVGQSGRVVTVSVSVDLAWVADPARVFPVTIDPTYYANTSNKGTDTYVESDSSSSGWSSTLMRVGYGFGTSGTAVARTLVRFDLGSAPASTDVVSEAHLSIYNKSSSSCVPTSVFLKGLAAGFNSGTVWSNQPAADSFGTVSTTVFANGFAACNPDGAWEQLDLTSLAKRWFESGASNFGLRLQSNEAATGGWKKFDSGETGGNSAPALWVTYSHRPSVPTPTVSPCGTCTGTLATNSTSPMLGGVF